MDFRLQPPLAGNAAYDHREWYEVAAELRQHRGEWAVVLTAPVRSVVDSTSTYIKNGKVKAFRPAGAFVASTRINPDGGFDLWASYIG